MLKVGTLPTNLELFHIVCVIKFLLVTSDRHTTSLWLPQMDPSTSTVLQAALHKGRVYFFLLYGIITHIDTKSYGTNMHTRFLSAICENKLCWAIDLKQGWEDWRGLIKNEWFRSAVYVNSKGAIRWVKYAGLPARRVDSSSVSLACFWMACKENIRRWAEVGHAYKPASRTHEWTSGIPAYLNRARLWSNLAPYF